MSNPEQIPEPEFEWNERFLDDVARLRRLRGRVQRLTIVSGIWTAILWWLMSRPETNPLALFVQLVPRFWWMGPWLIAGIGAVICWRRGLKWILLGGFVAAIPVQDFQWKGMTSSEAESQDDLVIATLNVADFRHDVFANLREMERLRAQVLIFQESESARDQGEFLRQVRIGRHSARYEEYLVAAPHPVTFLSAAYSDSMRRHFAAAFRVEDESRSLLVINVHLSSWQYIIPNFPGASTINEMHQLVQEHAARRLDEAHEVLALIEAHRRPSEPVIVAGDFNAESRSTVMRALDAAYADAFERAGWGYGFTAVDYFPWWAGPGPWLRIDHILVSDEWQVVGSSNGIADGSDHRTVFARLRRTE